MARYTGLSVDYVKKYNLRIEILRFCKELLRDEGRTVGRIDSRYTGIDRFADGDAIESDPSLDATTGPYTAALNAYVRSELDYESDLPVRDPERGDLEELGLRELQERVRRRLGDVRATMSRNPFMKVFVANGYLDLATPYFATEYTFNHMGLADNLRDNITMEYYDAGHMMYVQLSSLERLATDLREFVAEAG